MKKIIFTCCFLAAAVGVSALSLNWEMPSCHFAANEGETAQAKPAKAPEDLLIINEFMYNNPGIDDYEFIEVYNAGDVVLNLEGYRFTQGITFTFPLFTLMPEAFVVIAIDSAKFREAFNVTAFQWDEGQQLNNTGELIMLQDAAGNILDTVRYSAAGPWPVEANGGGPSVQLCDPASNNSDPANWSPSYAGTGFFINGIEILATPGAPNDCTPPPPPDYPAYPIGLVTTVDGQGVTDSLNVLCQLQGVVYGINLRASGLQFTIIDDENDGIGVFSSNATYGYTVTEGDELIIRGRITQFNGLTQIQPDTLWVVSENNPLFPPTVVTQLNESTESQLVRIENLSLVNPAQWTNTGTGFNVDATNGSTVFQMRIVSTSNIFGTLPPTGSFNLTGIGGQFDNSLPYTEGYQIFPRFLSDFEPISSAEVLQRKTGITLSPNPNKGDVWIRSEMPFDAIRITDMSGRTVFFSWFAPQLEMQLHTSAIAPGIYQVTLLSGKEMRTVQMVVSSGR